MPTYLKYKYIFFFISNSGRIRSRIQIFFQLSRIRGKKMSDPHPWSLHKHLSGLLVVFIVYYATVECGSIQEKITGQKSPYSKP